MENMSKTRTSSSPEFLCQSLPMAEPYDDSALEGVASNIKLLLKLVEDHKDACSKTKKDSRRMLRVAGMMTILDMVRTRIQKCQSFGSKKTESDLRRCNTDLRGQQLPVADPRDNKVIEQPADEKEKLRRELSTSIVARKSMEVMCSSLGKEKKIMAMELARKVQQLNGMEEHINDLKAQNQTLLEKVHDFHAENNGTSGDNGVNSSGGGGGGANVAALEARNKILSAQLVRSIEGYRSMKWKLKEVQEENLTLRGAMQEMESRMESTLKRILSLKTRVTEDSESISDINGEIEELERCFKWFEKKISKYNVKGKKPSGDKD